MIANENQVEGNWTAPGACFFDAGGFGEGVGCVG